MYCLHEVRQRRRRSNSLFRRIDYVHSYWIQFLQKRLRLFLIELRIDGLDEEKECIICGQGKFRHSKQRMMRLGEAIQRQHSKHGKQTGKQDSELERNND